MGRHGSRPHRSKHVAAVHPLHAPPLDRRKQPRPLRSNRTRLASAEVEGGVRPLAVTRRSHTTLKRRPKRRHSLEDGEPVGSSQIQGWPDGRFHSGARHDGLDVAPVQDRHAATSSGRRLSVSHQGELRTIRARRQRTRFVDALTSSVYFPFQLPPDCASAVCARGHSCHLPAA
jgi:hypothetical protein